MKFILPFIFLAFSIASLNAQCDDLFFSEYVEGYANNKALEIYNPLDVAVNLSEYSIARASNGSTAPAGNQIISLPDVMLEANDVFVVVVDLRDTSLWDSQFDKPAWNGYNVIDTIFDAVTGEAITDSLGNIIMGPQYTENGEAIYGDEYNEMYDLQCKADAFLCPDYDQNNTMYFNGNDAVILLKGDAISSTGDNILDVIGVIGEDPEDTIGEDAWVNKDGFWLTKNRTLVRKSEISTGRNDLMQTVFALGGTFDGEEWLSYRNNTFDYLGIHDSDCNNTETPDKYSCSEGPITSTFNLNAIDFTIYPNPNSTGEIFIESDENFKRIEIYDVVGKRVLTQMNEYNKSNVPVTVSQLERGIYVVRVIVSNNEWSARKLIIE